MNCQRRWLACSGAGAGKWRAAMLYCTSHPKHSSQPSAPLLALEAADSLAALAEREAAAAGVPRRVAAVLPIAHALRQGRVMGVGGWWV